MCHKGRNEFESASRSSSILPLTNNRNDCVVEDYVVVNIVMHQFVWQLSKLL